MQDTILIIDDQWSMQELARIVLRTAGYQVLLAGDAVTGLCLARAEHPAAIVLDALLPDRQSGMLLKELHRDPKTAVIPVILITTGIQEAHLRDELHAAGRCLHKPFPAPQLLTVVDGALHRDIPLAG